jgi:NAD+ synthase (glutamine-hydrolysing)
VPRQQTLNIKIHQFRQKLSDFDYIFEYLEKQIANDLNNPPTMHVYPELFLTGYPLQDMCLQKSFIMSYQKHLGKINELALKTPESGSIHLLGGLYYEMSESGIPRKIENSVYQFSASRNLEKIYSKMLLPNYDIFDERKYFTPGTACKFINWQNNNIAILICEDMWPSVHYRRNPIEELKTLDVNFDLVVNLSASPYHTSKDQSRIVQASKISNFLKAPFVYCNLVALEDEILFDGESFIQDAGNTLLKAPSFAPEILEFELNLNSNTEYSPQVFNPEHSWEDLFTPNLITQNRLAPLTEGQLKGLSKAIPFGLQEYANDANFKHFVIALSGGIDSALTLALTKLSLQSDQTVEAIYMPSQFSSSESYELSLKMCNNLGIKLINFPIKFLHSMLNNSFTSNFNEPLNGLADENIQARLRALILMGRSNQKNSLVINTSNKSEIAVGYSTLYGDSVGAISIIGDLYKSEVYQLARHLNSYYEQEIIPEGILERGPSAELRENQLDSDSLPPYEILDTILECFLSNRFSRSEILELGISAQHVDKVLQLHVRSEFKRKQFCPILKLKIKSFGFGHRIPINKNTEFYFNN